MSGSEHNDVSLCSHLTDKIGAVDRHLTAEIAALRRESESAARNSETAIKVAHDEASERLALHNNLIAQMKEQATNFATRESLEEYKKTQSEQTSDSKRFQWMLMGGLIVVGAIGIANLVKIWTP